ncbi:MAG: DUF4923 family protein [Duncaniella sp.]|nr:DUF4923 family protein [Duncaniella sp.]
MKRIVTLLTLVLGVMISSPRAAAFDLNSILGSVSGSGQSTDSTTTTTADGKGLGDMIGGVAAALGIGNDKATIESLAGDWAYVGPAVTFVSDNFLLKAGGAAAASTIEKKLEPYYKKARLENLVLTIGADSTFVMKSGRIKLQGVIERNADSGNYQFKFNAVKGINILTMPAYIKLTGKSRLALTFDVSKLIKLIEVAGSVSGSSTIKGVSSVLNQYDGLTAGFDLKRTEK